MANPAPPQIITLTGARDFPERFNRPLFNYLATLPDYALIVVGCAPGFDQMAALWFIENRRNIQLHGVVAAPDDPNKIPWLDLYGGWERMPPGTSYKDRDQRMVELSTRLVSAWPRYPEWDFNTKSGDPRSKRSGTWMTVRLARAAGKIVDLHILSELDR